MKVGDKVRIVRTTTDRLHGAIGTLAHVGALDDQMPYRVMVDGEKDRFKWWCYEVEPIAENLPARAHDTTSPVNPLDVVVSPGKATLRSLLAADEAMRREGAVAFPFLPEQRAAVSAYWSAQLRAQITASAERDRHRVLVDLQDEP